VYIDTTSCATTYVSATSLTFTSPAKSAGSYHLYVYNTDGSSGILPSGFVSSSIPVWVTASGALNSAATNNVYSQSVSATGDGTITYSLTTGSLPTGLSLNTSTGAITGTPTVAATSNFTITATDSQNQPVARSFSIQVIDSVSVDYAVVAGGGAGGYGSYGTGGGGAGGYLTAAGVLFNPGVTYTITAGAGGPAASLSNGNNSAISGTGLTTVTALGGGGGGGYTSLYQNGANGGSGGGGASNSSSDGKGGKGVYPGSTYLSQARQGYDGGTGNSNGGNASQNGGGGGGAGGAGQSPSNGQTSGGAGGVGVANPFAGSTVGQNVGGTYYLAGGGGAGTERNSSPGGAGGSGGGGQGQGSGTTYTAGATNTGGGGGGGGYAGAINGLAGGSGVVILRVDSAVTASSTTGSPVVTTSGAYKFYTFTASGSITF